MAENDLLPPPAPIAPAPAPEPAPRSTRVLCEFCGCELDPKGNVLRRGDVAREYLDLEDKLKHANAQIDTLAATNAELSRQLEAARNPPKRRGFLSDL
jgi:hypothetical protein